MVHFDDFRETREFLITPISGFLNDIDSNQ
jgi:hypothetical protein